MQQNIKLNVPVAISNRGLTRNRSFIPIDEVDETNCILQV